MTDFSLAALARARRADRHAPPGGLGEVVRPAVDAGRCPAARSMPSDGIRLPPLQGSVVANILSSSRPRAGWDPADQVRRRHPGADGAVRARGHHAQQATGQPGVVGQVQAPLRRRARVVTAERCAQTVIRRLVEHRPRRVARRGGAAGARQTNNLGSSSPGQPPPRSWSDQKQA